MNNASFEFIRKFIKEQTAISLDPDKGYLVEGRLNPIAKKAGFSCLDDLITEIKLRPTHELKLNVIDAMTTNETLFFRDVHPFEYLKKEILPNLIAKQEHVKRLNIWCAASSGGQEPYTIAMLLNEHIDSLKGWTIDFIASDISEKMIEKAKAGIYNQLEINRGLPTSYLINYFSKVGADWQINEEIRNMVKYQKINLMSPWSLNSMDLVFMRNVLIYFDMETRKDIFKRMEKTLNPGGYFFLGGAETTLGINNEFERVECKGISCYQLKNKITKRSF